MKLIRKLGCLDTKQSWGLFKCPYCLQEVIKRLHHGLRDISCGCMKSIFSSKNGKQNVTHDGRYTKLYSVWINMKTRCFNVNTDRFKDYGGRGITICPEWTESYIKFRDWSLANDYAEGLQINRINNDGNYEPSNCNFITAKENANNRRNNQKGK